MSAAHDFRPWRPRVLYGPAAVRRQQAEVKKAKRRKVQTDTMRARALWVAGHIDTMDIATTLGIPEHRVCKMIWGTR